MYSFPPLKFSKVTMYDKAFFTVDLKDLAGFFPVVSYFSIFRQAEAGALIEGGYTP